MIHRDLKTENVFLARSESSEIPKVLDFGVAKSLSTGSQETLDTDAGVVVGTVRYMAPEQLLGNSADPAWDLWALGVVAYEMLTGAQPFPASTVAECHAAVLAGTSFQLANKILQSVQSRLECFS